ncbi:MAG TPA: glutamyl-tRNA reductase [Solirubrobacteraceae bacterium]|jgi:glutamyl-tRNA reductase|nr:glutamyl-tRNA reductase [Solirubrobacteraceae bacterium]
MSVVILLGISHKTAPVALREKLALPAPQLPAFLQGLVATPALQEAVAISTCNRTELYLVASDDGVEGESAALGALAGRAGIRPTELAEVIYSPRNCDAARQLFRVTAGLESMIVGESEVQGQVKRAYEAALEAGTTGPLTNRLFGAALAAGKRVRAETGIGAGAASVSSVAVDLATEVLGDLAGRPVVIIGAGETSELTAQALAARGVTTIFVANRRADRARSLAERFGGTVLPLDRLPDQLEHADVLLCATASPHAIVEREELELVMRNRGGRPLLILDIAVPRDVEAACGDLDGVRLVDMDGLQRVVARNLRVREDEAARGEAIVEEEIGRFASWLGSLDVVPTIAALRAHGERIVEGVVAENAGRWESASPRDVARAEAIARAVMSRLLHEPTLQLKEHGSHARLALTRELFGLADPPAEVEDSDPAEVRQLRRRAR